MTKIEDIVDNLNGFGRYQKLRFFLLCLSGLLPPIASYMHSFIAPTPRYSCATMNTSNFAPPDVLHYYHSTEYKLRCFEYSILNSTGSNRTFRSASSSSSSSLLTQPISNAFINRTISGDDDDDENMMIGYKKKCPTNFVFDKTYYQTTLTEQWSLVCDKAIWRPLMQTIYFTGVLFGSIILGIVGRKFGQKMTLILSSLITLVGSAALSFGPQEFFGDEISYLLLVTGRFLIAFGSHGISINGYLLVMEFIGKKQKRYCALVFEFSFSFGQLVLVLAAYFLPEWRKLTFTILLPCLPFFLFIYFSNESIQYLIRHKKFDKIETVLTRIAKSNKTNLDQASWKAFLTKENEKSRKSSCSTSHLSRSNFIYLIVIILNWIVNNFVFHGLGLRSNDLGVNPYLTFALAATAELICSIFTFELLKFNFRRVPYFFFMLLTGVCCTTVYYSTNLLLTISSALIARFSVSSTYAIIRLYTNEFLPEESKKTYMTKCSVMARLGAVIAPLIIAFGDYYFKQLPFLIFGISCFVSALSTLILPRIEKDRHDTDLKKIDNNPQLLQNNWLDVQDIYDLENLESNDDTEMKPIKNDTTNSNNNNNSNHQNDLK